MRKIWGSRDSGAHKELKKLAANHLRGALRVSGERISEEFPIGPYKFDVVAYPNRSFSNSRELSIIAVKCGNIQTNNHCAFLSKISDMLNFVDLVIWAQCNVYSPIFEDALTKDLSEFDLYKVTMPIGDNIYGLAFCKGETYTKLKGSGQEFLQE